MLILNREAVVTLLFGTRVAAVSSISIKATIISVIVTMPIILFPLTGNEIIRSKAATNISISVESASGVILTQVTDNGRISISLVICNVTIFRIVRMPELRMPTANNVLILARSSIRRNHTRKNGAINESSPLAIVATARMIIDVRLATVSEIKITVRVTVEGVTEHVANTSLGESVASVFLTRVTLTAEHITAWSLR